MSDEEPLLTTSELASYLGCSPWTINEWRKLGRGPRFIRLVDSKQSPVRYLRSDVDAWIKSQSVSP